MAARWNGGHPQTLAVVALFATAAVLRIHNAWVALPLSGFDGPYHASYAGIVLFEGRLPLPHEGWSTFHPPLYYALCALVWGALPDAVPPRGVLFALRLLGVFAGLATGAFAWLASKRLFPDRPRVALFAGGVALFVPMHAGASSVLGNEVLASALCALSLLLLLRCLEGPTPARAAWLGLSLGLALLTKFSALLVALWSLAALGGWGLRRTPRALGPAVAAAAVLVLVAGWYFARNVAHYGRPTLMQNEIVTEAMAKRGYGPARPLAAYVSLHPGILVDPFDRTPAAMRAVWPVTFASIWYDVRMTSLDAGSRWGRTFAPVLLACGALFTALALLGARAAATGRAPTAVPLGAATLLAMPLLALASYVVFTREIATFSALKGSYLSPALLPFAVLAGLGADGVGRRSAVAARALAVFLAVFVAAVTAIYWSGWLAPLRVNPGEFAIRAYSDPPTQRVFEYFADGDP